MKKINYLLAGIVVLFVTILACDESEIVVDELQNLQKEEISTKNDKVKEHKVAICHKAGNKWIAISVASSLLDAHMEHGDKYDADGDGYYPENECGIWEDLGYDCDDTDASLNLIDADGDGWTTCDGDCDDSDDTINPDAEEICGDGIDNDCDGEIDECTYVPDDNFEQALNDILGDTSGLDDYVLTENINTLTSLDVSEKDISDLTGIEDFTALTELNCQKNNLTSLNISTNTALTVLRCYQNLLTSLDVSTNIALVQLRCAGNNLTSLNVSANTALNDLWCQNNGLTSLDVSNNTALTNFRCYNNPTLTCIQVNSTQLSSIPTSWSKDVGATYSTSCP